MPDVELPSSGWLPRPHQRKLWAYLEDGGKRAFEVAHRRWGKDDVALHWTAVAAFQRVANYWHMLPEANQARKAIWEAVNPHTGRRRIDEAFPKALRASMRDDTMTIRFINGSTWQVVGSDNFDSLVGSTPAGIIFSEWALAKPDAWPLLRPILLENGGWAIFITTSRGRNHAATMYAGAKNDPMWFVEMSTADQTSVFTPEQLAQERLEYIRDSPEDGEAKYEQEYMCSFDAAVSGSYYGKLMQAMEAEERIGFVPYDPRLKVMTAWDLGYGDTTPIWFAQFRGPEICLIDFYETSGKGIDHYVAELNKRPYVYAEHLVPHDAEVGELGTGKRRIDVMRSLGMAPRVVVKLGVDDGIAAVRAMLPRVRIDRAKCARGIAALQQYRKSWDQVNRIYRPTPVHDWTSHAADAARYLAVGMRERPETKPVKLKMRVPPPGRGAWMG